MKIPTRSDLDTKGKRGSLYLSKHYPEFFELLCTKYPHTPKCAGKLYLYWAGMSEPRCPVCGSYVPYLDESRGFQKFCSRACAAQSDDTVRRRERTCMERYGSTSAAQSEPVKQKLINTYTNRYGGMGNASETVKQKQRGTMSELYGTEYALQNQTIKDRFVNTSIDRHGGVGLASKDIKSKFISTSIERHGGVGLASNGTMKKFTDTCLSRFGVEVPSQCPEIIYKINNTKRVNKVRDNVDILDIKDTDRGTVCLMKCPHRFCNKCNAKSYEIPTSVLYDRRRDGTELCTRLLPVRKGHNTNTSIELFVRGVLEECGISVPENHENRSVLHNRGLDFYLPDRNLAIECNGCYWHSTHNQPNTGHHMNKYKECENRGIQLLTLWQDWIVTKPEIVRSIIRSKLGCTERIGARECVVCEVSATEANRFLESNHIQGKTNSKWRLGLYKEHYVNSSMVRLELVALMCFGHRKSLQGAKNDDAIELLRYCSKCNLTVVGGASRLLSRFIKNHKPARIISFSSNDISNGSLYRTLRFTKVRENNSYWYVDKLYRRYHRSSFTKSRIKKLGWAPEGNWKEADVMYRRGYLQIYDSGQTKWELIL